MSPDTTSSQAQGEVLPEKFSLFVDDLEDPQTKQNIAFQALKPFIPPENRELYAESLAEDVAKACDSQEGESNTPGEGQEEEQEVIPMSFAACHEIVIGQPTTPIYTYIFPIDCSEVYDRTGVVRIGDEVYDQKSVCLVYAYPGGGFRTMHPYGDLYQNGEYKGSYEVMCRKAEIERCQRAQKGDPQLVILYTKAEESYLGSVEKAIRKWVNSMKQAGGDASATISSHNPGPGRRKRAAPADADAKCPPKRSRPCKSMSVYCYYY